MAVKPTNADLDAAVLSSIFSTSSSLPRAFSPVSAGGTDIVFSRRDAVPPASLRPHPLNATLFQAAKDNTPDYWRALTESIRRDTIKEPIIVVSRSDLTIISGHSRHQIALTLLAQGDLRFEVVPVVYCETPLSVEEIEHQVVDLNLTRFEMDSTTRVRLLARLYPDFFDSDPSISSHSNLKHSAIPQPTSTSVSIASRTRTTPQFVNRQRKIHQTAQAISASRGDGLPTDDDYEVARKAVRAGRHSPTPCTIPDPPVVFSVDVDTGISANGTLLVAFNWQPASVDYRELLLTYLTRLRGLDA